MKNTLPHQLLRIPFACVLAIAALASLPLHAADVTWDGTTDMTWTQPDSTSWNATYNSGDTAQFLGAGAGTVTIDAGGVTPGAVIVNSSANYTFTGGAIGNNGTTTLSKNGTGTLTLSNANTYTGLTTVSGGVLDVGVMSSNAVSNSSGIFISNNATLQGSGTFTRALVDGITPGAGQVASAAGGFAARGGQLTVTFSNNSSAELGMWSSGQFGTNLGLGSTSADSKVVVTNNINLNTSGQRVVTVTAGVGGAEATSAELSGVIRNSNVTNGGITKRGNGLLILSSTANSFDGLTSIEAGTLSIASIKSIGGGNSSLGAVTTSDKGRIMISSGGTLRYTGTGDTTDRRIFLSSTSGNVTLDQSGAGLLKFTSNIGGADANTGNKTFILQGSTTGTGEISGNILDPAVTGNLAVTKTGTGTWTLSGNNTYTGLTTVSGGVLDVGVISSNAISNSSGIFLSGGGILQGSGTFTRSSSGTATPGADQYGSADGGFAARGGQLTVTFSNNSSTELSMNAGGFRFGTNFAFGSTSADNKVVLTNNIDLNSAGQRVFTVTAGVGGASATSAELSGVIRNTNATPGGITKRGDGMLILANTNSSYGGATTVENGILSIASIKNVGGGNSSLGAPTTVANGTITLGAAGAATLLYTGNATSTDRVIALSNTNNGATLDQSGTGLLKFTSNMTTGSNSKTLTLQGSTSGTGEISGNIPNVSGGNLTVTKTGTGTWTLTGNNTYAGQTTVTVGTLLVSNSSGSATGTGSVSVQGGATLAGTGFIAPGGSNGLTVLSTGIIAPGITGTTGNLTINGSGTSGVAATFNLGAVFALDLNATTVVSDRLVLTNGAAGDFAFGGNTINFNILTGTIADGQTYILFSGTNANQFAGLTLDGGNFITAGLTIGNGLPGAFGANSNLQVVGNNIVLNAIPEPSTWALLALSLTTVMVLRRRRNS